MEYMDEIKNTKVERDRCPTGIDGLDNILNGGIPRGNTILFTGSCGTGKTTLSLEFLVHGALAGENSLFVSVTESSEKLTQNVIDRKSTRLNSSHIPLSRMPSSA